MEKACSASARAPSRGGRERNLRPVHRLEIVNFEGMWEVRDGQVVLTWSGNFSAALAEAHALAAARAPCELVVVDHDEYAHSPDRIGSLGSVGPC